MTNLQKELNKHLTGIADTLNEINATLIKKKPSYRIIVSEDLPFYRPIKKETRENSFITQDLDLVTFNLFDPRKLNNQGIIPELTNFDANYTNITAELDFKLTFNENNPLEITEFNFNIYIYLDSLDSESSIEVKYEAAWHCDYHTGIRGTDKTTHPLFHIQFGGNSKDNEDEKRVKITAKVEDSFKSKGTGGVLYFPTPRIASPPMDAALGLDFFLSNYLHKDYYMKIIEDTRYSEAIKYSQDVFWKPYYTNIANFWQPGASTTDKENAQKYIPHLDLKRYQQQ